MRKKLVAIIKMTNEKIGPQRTGHTFLQKLLYLSKEMGVELEYEWRLHHYGPYSPELWSDILLLDSQKLVEIKNEEFPEREGHYYIIKAIAEGDIPEREREIVDRVIAELEELRRKNLTSEAVATIWYVASRIKEENAECENFHSKVREWVLRLKPHFESVLTESTVRDVIDRFDRIKSRY